MASLALRLALSRVGPPNLALDIPNKVPLLGSTILSNSSISPNSGNLFLKVVFIRGLEMPVITISVGGGGPIELSSYENFGIGSDL
ncbi:hypothetical protein WICMUC_002187 [Wickerhamomyces mucosus]|uniref:Uncharacterized protein n=1 Tax=Wickerhamomyces mucosus TaxID=1378264 RepID=A0A9P8PR58_9ASCO|nr:hypothetical protein WICMUC_002187 [Wickerhamomyces mucosus]